MTATLDRLRQELRRLTLGAGLEEIPQGSGTVRVIAQCIDPEQVRSRAKEVLEIVVRISLDSWPDENQWRRVLPKWFVDKCGPDLTPAEAESEMARMRGLSKAKRDKIRRERPWSVSGWVYWFRPEQRQWYWWDAMLTEKGTLVVAIEVDGWPFPWASLKWLLCAAGAHAVEAEE